MLQLIVDNISSVLKTDDKALLTALGKIYACKVPGYQFVSAYKKGHWRGEKQFFSPKIVKPKHRSVSVTSDVLTLVSNQRSLLACT